jgi:hypothetical protein
MQLEQFITENPKFAGKMMVIMGNRLANTNDLLLEKISELGTKEAEFSGENEKPLVEETKFASSAPSRIVRHF